MTAPSNEISLPETHTGVAGFNRNSRSTQRGNEYIRYPGAAPNSGDHRSLFHQNRRYFLCQRRNDVPRMSKRRISICAATAIAPDRHPGMLPGARELKVKLIFADRSGIILGGQISGGPSVGELINVIALAIQKKVNVRELDMFSQIAPHPLLTSAPTVHPLINAAHQALAKLRVTLRELAPQLR